MNSIVRDAGAVPTEEQLAARLTRHLDERPGEQTVVLAWDSYLSALLEWGLLDHLAYDRLSDLLPSHERSSVEEILLGFDGDGDGAGLVARTVDDTL